MGKVAPRSVVASLLAVLLLAVAGTNAHAATYDFTVSPDPPNAGQQATLTMVSDSTDPVSVFWDLDGVGEFEESGASVTHVFAQAGANRVRMRVVDLEDKQRTITRMIVVNAPPAVDFGFAPAAPVTGDDVLFTPVVSDPEGDPLTLSWSFGDGGSSADGAPSHAYATAGTYSAV